MARAVRQKFHASGGDISRQKKNQVLAAMACASFSASIRLEGLA